MIKMQGKYMPAGTEYPPKAENVGPLKPITLKIPVADIGGQIVPDSSQEAQDFLRGSGDAEVFAYGSLKYSDFFGIYKAQFCTPLYTMQGGTSRASTPAEKKCTAYNRQEDQYTQMPSVAKPTPNAVSRVEPIKCIAPTD
jgi:hypothetical protein